MLFRSDYYYNKKENELALKHYTNAHKLAQKDFSKDNIAKIEIRINDIKIRIGEERFNILIKEMNYAK